MPVIGESALEETAAEEAAAGATGNEPEKEDEEEEAEELGDAEEAVPARKRKTAFRQEGFGFPRLSHLAKLEGSIE